MNDDAMFKVLAQWEGRMAAEFETHRLRTGLDIERLAKEFGKEVRDEIKAVREEVKKARNEDRAEARRRNRWLVGLAVGVAGGIATLLLRAFGG